MLMVEALFLEESIAGKDAPDFSYCSFYYSYQLLCIKSYAIEITRTMSERANLMDSDIPLSTEYPAPAPYVSSEVLTQKHS